MKKFYLGLVIIVLVCAASMFFFRQPANSSAGQEEVITRPDFRTQNADHASPRPKTVKSGSDRSGFNVKGKNELFEQNGSDYAKSVEFILSTYAADTNRQRVLLGQLAEFAGMNGQSDTLKFLDVVDDRIAGQLRGWLYSSALEKLAERTPNDAISAAERLGVGKLKADTLAVIISAWSKKDLLAAAVAASGFDFTDERTAASQMFGLQVKEDISGALGILKNAKVASEIKAQLARDIGKFWEGNINELIRSIESSDPTRMSDAIGEYSLTHATETLPVLIAKPDLISNSMVNGLVGSLASSDPVGSLNMMLSSPEFQHKDDLITGTFARWLHQDSEQASQWLGTSASPYRDVLVERMVGYLMQSGDPQSAGKWAESISDPAIRERIDKRLPKRK